MESSIALITGVVVFAAALVGLVTQLAKRVERKVDEVHVMVNSRMEEALALSVEALALNAEAVERVDQLLEALRTAGIKVPDMPNHNPNPQ